jgi:citronellol/citronellal dehydrogenase
MQSYLVPDANAGSVALVTGGGTGIGRAIVDALAASGASIAICGRRAEPLEETRAAIEAGGGECLTFECDVREPEQVDGLLEAVGERYGRLDVLVNNAGGQFLAAADKVSSKGFRAVHRLNVDAVWDVTHKAATRFMIPQRSGVVLFIGFSPVVQPGYLHATTARAAIQNLTAGLAAEWSQHGIRTVQLQVGNVLTDGAVEAYGAEVVEGWEKTVPLGRLGRPEDVAHAAAFFASPAAAWITGTSVAIDGGQATWGSGPPA